LVEAVAAAAGSMIEPADLPFRFRTGLDAQGIGPRRPLEPINLELLLREIEEREIRRVLAACRENRARAARLLGMTRPKLYRRMEQLGIVDAPQGRSAHVRSTTPGIALTTTDAIARNGEPAGDPEIEAAPSKTPDAASPCEHET
jgi:hypothetical protein